MEIDLELYRVFYFTAREGSVSKAAQLLYISQPAVSHSIKRLEELLGAPLFIRRPRGVELTKEARFLYDDVEQAYSLIEEAQKVFLQKKQAIEHDIRINATEILSRFCLVPYLREFSQTYPQVRILLSSRGTPEALNLLKQGQLDLALATLPAPDAVNLRSRHYMTFQDCFVVGDAYRHLAQAEISFRALCEYPILLLRNGMNSRFFVNKLAKAHGIQLVPQMEVESIDTLIHCAAAGCGVSFVVRELAEEELSTGKIHIVPLKESIPPRTIGLVTRSGEQDEYLEKFMEGLVAFNG